MSRLRLALWLAADLVNGIWSGYPLCCVFAYVRLAAAGHAPAEAANRRFDAGDEWAEFNRGVEYVRCGSCRRHGFVAPWETPGVVQDLWTRRR